MQKSQLEVDQWPASLMRTRSGNSRDNKKVSCETLSKVDWYSRRPHEAQLYYQSDGDDERNPASEAEDEHEVEEDDDDKEGRGHTGKLETHGYGEALSAQGHHFLVCFPSKLPAHIKPAIAISSPGRDAKKSERGPRTYPSPVPHSGSLLPQSGRLLPHSGPIKLHVGSHTNTHTNSKIPGSIRGSSLIPANIEGKSSKSSGFGNANEPSSPKVTCLGRVKIKQKYCREMGRLADMAAVAPNEKMHKSIGDQMMKLKRRMHKAHAAEEVVPTEERQKALPKVAAISGRGKVLSEEGKKANKAHILSPAGATTDLKQSQHGWGSHAEDILRTDAVSDSESTGQKGKWRLKEASVRMKLRVGDKKKQHLPDALDTRPFSSQADCAIDLNRFRSLDQLQMQDNRFSKSSARLSIGDESQKIEQADDMEFVPQVPPPNSLLLMRNSKNRGACGTIAASSSCRRHKADSYEEAVLVDKQVHLSSLKDESLKQLTSSLLGMEMDERELATTAIKGQEQAAETKVMKLCVVVPTECEPLQMKTNELAHSLPKMPPEPAYLWQRRSVMKPSALHVG